MLLSLALNSLCSQAALGGNVRWCGYFEHSLAALQKVKHSLPLTLLGRHSTTT
jgi:hypothetical protein